MIALFILLAALAVSIFINRIAAKALMLTGLSKDVAEFQARSAATGTGFTTDEAESLVNHPARRRVVMPLMLIQNAGLVTVISTFVLSFVNTDSTLIALQRGLILIGGIGFLLYLAQNKWVEHQLEKLMDWLLEKYTNLEVVDYQTLLHVQKGYTISRFTISQDSWLANKALRDIRLQDEGIVVLSIKSEDGSINGSPVGDDILRPGDEISVYGKGESISELNKRLDNAAGDRAHEEAIAEHEKSVEEGSA